MKNMLTALAGLMALGFSSATHATIISLDFDLNASGFGAGAPVDPVVGNFQITFDNTANIFSASLGMVVTDFNLPFFGDYSYNAAHDQLFVGTTTDPGSAGVFGGGGYGFEVLNASSAPSIAFFQYGIFYPTERDATINTATQFTITPVAAPTGVPEPSAWALLIAGLAITGAALRAGPRKASQARRPARPVAGRRPTLPASACD